MALLAGPALSQKELQAVSDDEVRAYVKSLGYEKYSELNAQQRKVAQPLSKLSTASFQIRADNPLADQIMTCQGYIKS